MSIVAVFFIDSLATTKYCTPVTEVLNIHCCPPFVSIVTPMHALLNLDNENNEILNCIRVYNNNNNNNTLIHIAAFERYFDHEENIFDHRIAFSRERRPRRQYTNIIFSFSLRRI